MTEHYKFENYPLPYAYDALEPYIDTETMHLHHDRHLQTYVDNLNKALKDSPRLQKLSLEQLICMAGQLPKTVRIPVSRNAGGVFNHRFFFEGMSPRSQKLPAGQLGREIDIAFGSFDGFRERFKESALSVFGSGYTWLAADKRGKLKIITTANQETPLTAGLTPIITIDLWEHAYYLKHFNKRADYVDAWFHVADWSKAEENYMVCL